MGSRNGPYDQLSLREASESKNVPKSGKTPQFSFPPHPQDVLDFFEFGENWKFDDPPLGLIWEKFEIGKISNSGNLPSEKKKLKTLKIA